MNDHISEIKKLLDSESLIIGSERALKALRANELKKIYLATNPKVEVKEDILAYANLANVEIVELDIPNDELGVACKKPFAISVIGLRSE